MVKYCLCTIHYINRFNLVCPSVFLECANFFKIYRILKFSIMWSLLMLEISWKYRLVLKIKIQEYYQEAISTQLCCLMIRDYSRILNNLESFLQLRHETEIWLLIFFVDICKTCWPKLFKIVLFTIQSAWNQISTNVHKF